MNLLELQTRANLLVDKVNAYEASLTGTEIDETDTLNQHIYADLYCLRPVMKLLFGTTVDEKLSRTLDNDISLPVFATTAPAWNSSFNMLTKSSKAVTVNPSSTFLKNAGSHLVISDASAYAYSEDNYVLIYNTYTASNQTTYNRVRFTTGSDVTTRQTVYNPSYFVYSGKYYPYYTLENGVLYMTTSAGTYTVYSGIQANTSYDLASSRDYTYFYPDISDTSQYYLWNRPMSGGSSHSGWYCKLGEAYDDNSSHFLGTYDLNYTTVYSSYTFQNIFTGAGTIHQLFIYNQIGGAMEYEGYYYGYYNSSSAYHPDVTIYTLPEAFSYTEKGSIDTPQYAKIYTQFKIKFNTTVTRYLLTIRDSLTSTTLGQLYFVANTSAGTTIIHCPGTSSHSTCTLSGVGTNTILGFTMYVYFEAEGNLRFYITEITQNGEITGNQIIGMTENISSNIQLQFDCSNARTGSYSGYSLVGTAVDDMEVTYQLPVDINYSSSQHDFMNNIDMYNQYHMCQLDVSQNTLNTRDERIPLGINYGYSANIADALVTESQVANVFKWNTTSDTTIVNNTRTVNRQVPGIVCYYLGNDYTGTYTATIPYAPLRSNINSINYETPPYYGAYYNTDETQSQIPLEYGASYSACRIFMPGMNYTRGKLESPQQIWQPDRAFGTGNVGLGYNWQGKALYHELVFKQRRSGCKDAGIDFIPSNEDVADNDPQGLATRLVLAQQKPYYNGRPWFNELDDLYSVDTSKLVTQINNTALTEDVDTVLTYASFITVVGEPTVDELGIASGFSESSYYTLNASSFGTDCTAIIDFTTGSDISSQERTIIYVAKLFTLKILNGELTMWNFGNATRETGVISSLAINTEYNIKVVISDTTVTVYQLTNGVYTQIYTYTDTGITAPTSSTDTSLGIGETGYRDQVFNGLINLSSSSINNTALVMITGTTFNKSLFTTVDATISDSGWLTGTSGTTTTPWASVDVDIASGAYAHLEVYSPKYYLDNTISSWDSASSQFSINTQGSSTTGIYAGWNGYLSNDLSIISYGCRVVELGISSATLYPSASAATCIQFKFDITYDETNNQTTVAYYYRFDDGDYINLPYTRTFSAVYPDLGIVKIIADDWSAGTENSQPKIDLSTFKIIGDDKILYSALNSPTYRSLTDEEFYKTYKLDYETWANALGLKL